MHDMNFVENGRIVNQFLFENKENIADYMVNLEAKLPSMNKRYAIKQ